VYRVRLISATGMKAIDETTQAEDLNGTYVRREAHEADKSKLGYTPVHHKEDGEGRMCVCCVARQGSRLKQH
jgi:hypothetical protein